MIRRPAFGCGSWWTPEPGSGGTSPRADAGPEEVELKLAVLDATAIRALVLDPGASLPGVRSASVPRSIDLEDRYLDTDRGALRAAGLVARIRTGPGGRRLTVKSVARRGTGAVHRRLELEGDAGDARDPRSWPPSPARDRVVQAIGSEPLTTIASLRQTRLQRDVAVGTSVVELSLDEVAVVAGDGRQERWVELEGELRAGREADLAGLGELLLRRADLVPAATSKLERALATLGEAFTER